jgi:hypothetical protein
VHELRSIFDAQEEALKKHQPLIVVGTPGRLAEHSRKGTLATHHTGVLIMDEVRWRLILCGSLFLCMYFEFTQAYICTSLKSQI